MSKKCEECGKWLKNIRGYNIHYNRMHRQKQKTNNIETIELGEILNRIRKLELDNNFMKHQLKHKVFINNSKDSMLDWDNIKPEVKKAIDESEIKFNFVVSELKGIFIGDNFDYRDVLVPIEPISEPINIPMSIEI